MSELLLLPFEKVADAPKRLSRVGIPYLHLCPFHYHAIEVKKWPPKGSTVVVTSARSFEFHSHPSYWQDRRLFVVGKGTEAAATSLGIMTEYVGHVGGALTVSVASKMTDDVIYHLGGMDISAPLQKALNAVSHIRIPLYNRVRNDLFFTNQSSIKLSAIASPAAAEAIGNHNMFSRSPCVCIGETTMDAAQNVGLEVIGQAKLPRFSSLVEEAIIAYNRD